MSHISDDGLRLIQYFEGFSSVVYRDVAGLRTIGYGHLLRSSELLEHVTQEQAFALLSQDVARAERAVAVLIQSLVTPHQFDALVSFTFNLGAGALQRSTLRQKINRGEMKDAPPEFLRWVWAGGRKAQGLIRRRRAEAAWFSHA